MYIVVSEWLKLTNAVNLKKFKIDQIYVLRKQKILTVNLDTSQNTIKTQFMMKLLPISLILLESI